MIRNYIHKNFFLTLFLLAGATLSVNSQTDSSSVSHNGKPFIHRLELEGRPGYILPSNEFLRGENLHFKPIRQSTSAHLKYAFQFNPESRNGKIYRGVYQGIGVAYYDFHNSREIGNPLAFYLFQGATLYRFTPRLSLEYEWNFGISTGWKPYDFIENSYNGMIGSKINAYMNVNFYARQFLSRQFGLTYGVGFTHFSNGNTKFPNAGLNTVELKAGISYNINREDNYLSLNGNGSSLTRDFKRHVSYDVVLFGSWRRKGVAVNNEMIASPDSYQVYGFILNPMYNIGYKLRIGGAIDGVYDSSINVYSEDSYSDGGYGGYKFSRPPMHEQFAFGLSARAEYVMPYFDVGLGIGANILHHGGDTKGLYQILALKIKITRHSFIHIGYNLHNFDTPNYLMLGLGVRLNNRHP